jgi:hypothetical protein
MGIRLNEAERWGLDVKRLEDGMTFLSLEAYFHPQTVALFAQMLDAYNWWDNRFFAPFKPYKRLLTVLRKLHLLGSLARIIERDACRNTREEVNIITYRTPDYMLSCAQDYRKGYGGDQQHIWQATLGPDAMCFTTHPGNLRRDGETPNYWSGSGLLPRAVQVNNILIAIYNIKKIPALYVPVKHFFTHAWFPKDKFDEVIERDGWVFARKGEGYLALRSQHPYRWQTNDGEIQEHELIVDSAQNIWICELGRHTVDGAFENFIARICMAELHFDGLNVRYHSPSQGRLDFGWNAPFRQDGKEIQIHGYARYDNPYVQAKFPPDEIVIRYAEQILRLDWPS